MLNKKASILPRVIGSSIGSVGLFPGAVSSLAQGHQIDKTLTENDINNALERKYVDDRLGFLTGLKSGIASIPLQLLPIATGYGTGTALNELTDSEGNELIGAGMGALSGSIVGPIIAGRYFAKRDTERAINEMKNSKIASWKTSFNHTELRKIAACANKEKEADSNSYGGAGTRYGNENKFIDTSKKIFRAPKGMNQEYYNKSKIINFSDGIAKAIKKM